MISIASIFIAITVSLLYCIPGLISFAPVPCPPGLVLHAPAAFHQSTACDAAASTYSENDENAYRKIAKLLQRRLSAHLEHPLLEFILVLAWQSSRIWRENCRFAASETAGRLGSALLIHLRRVRTLRPRIVCTIFILSRLAFGRSVTGATKCGSSAFFSQARQIPRNFLLARLCLGIFFSFLLLQLAQTRLRQLQRASDSNMLWR
jgi:hypothetical protein